MLLPDCNEYVLSISDAKEVIRSRHCMTAPERERVGGAENVEPRSPCSEIAQANRHERPIPISDPSQLEYSLNIVWTPILAISRNSNEPAGTGIHRANRHEVPVTAADVPKHAVRRRDDI